MEKLSFIPKEEISENKSVVYGLAENTAERLMYVVNSKNIIDNEEINLDLLIAARETLDVAIEKQQEVLKDAL